eukprot:2947528-Pleurochrysis_carterae.AAC.1
MAGRSASGRSAWSKNHAPVHSSKRRCACQTNLLFHSGGLSVNLQQTSVREAELLCTRHTHCITTFPDHCPLLSFRAVCKPALLRLQVLRFETFETIAKLYKAITAMQCGEAEDKYGLTRVVGHKPL